MTKLIVKQIDPSAPGGFRERQVWRTITARLAAAAESNNKFEQLAAMAAAEDWVIARLRTDDGTPVDDVLDRISADEFDALLHAAGPEDAVPPENASNSTEA